MRIKVNRDNCTGCRLCLQICAIEHFSEINPKMAALRIEAKFPDPGKFRPFVCTQCGKCAEVCPYNAITVEVKKKTPAEVNTAACAGCGTCAAACPSGAITALHFTDNEIVAQIDGLLELVV